MKKGYPMRYLIFFLIIFVLSSNALAFEKGTALTDREIIESLVELKAGQGSLDKRFDDMGTRIDDLRGEMKHGYASLDTRIDDMKGLLYCILAGIFVLIGFVLWDRRTTLAPAVKKYDALEKTLIDYSDKHPDLKESLRHAGLL